MFKSSGNKVIDDFIRHTATVSIKKLIGVLEFVPYEQFKNKVFIAEEDLAYNFTRSHNYTVVLKKLNNSENFTSKELNELKVFYQIKKNYNSSYISEYLGITQDPSTKDIMIIMPYYNSGDLKHYLSNDFYNTSWNMKLYILYRIISGLENIHKANFIHRDLHSGNIFFNKESTYIGDLGISKSAIEATESTENYGIIPYMAPELFKGQKYTKASDIYSFGMIMWEFMTGRSPFWDENHDTELIIKIYDGLRPPIVTNAPEGYIELMKKCWHSDPNKRPTTAHVWNRINFMWNNESQNESNQAPTKIIESTDIGPVTKNNPAAIYMSRPSSHMIQTAMSLRSSRIQSIELDPFYYYQKTNKVTTDKRKFEDDPAEDCNDSKDNDQSNKKRKFLEDSDYFTREIELDINFPDKIIA
ncbi:hypothetical protein RclHR1_08470003 [Rhizophagus clarus]|uniref:Kinase-like domain-containing protein n=1 Tax=Rhizophagus clarus TaxID=94130 RepID=A0A2Z6SG06_9GLOM|nr:hypothetical protein RclHR1_08470003 [Rhizophagus clarus]GES79220.1 kinase-like domain-containing protein [Rhizophagus clarus]